MLTCVVAVVVVVVFVCSLVCLFAVARYPHPSIVLVFALLFFLLSAFAFDIGAFVLRESKRKEGIGGEGIVVITETFFGGGAFAVQTIVYWQRTCGFRVLCGLHWRDKPFSLSLCVCERERDKETERGAVCHR